MAYSRYQEEDNIVSEGEKKGETKQDSSYLTSHPRTEKQNRITTERQTFRKSVDDLHRLGLVKLRTTIP
jgi:hypothetical protein